MSRSWFNRLTFSYLPILIIVPAILMILFFLGSAELSKRETARANAVFSRQAVQSLDYSFRSIGEMMNREISSGEFHAFFSASENPYLAANDASTRLARLKLTNPLIDSIYIYRLSDGTVLSNQSIGRLETFSDRDYIEKVLAGPLPTRWSEPRELSGFGAQPRTVVTLTRGIPLLTGERGLMVVNVSLDSVRELLREMIGEETSFIHLYTANGALMLGTEADLPAADAEKLRGGEDRETAESSRELSAVTSSYTGWEVRSGVVGDSLSRILTSIWYVWIGAAALIVALGIGWAVLVSRRNYEPVMQLLERLDALPRGTAQAAAALTEAARFDGAGPESEAGMPEEAGAAESERQERRNRRGQQPDEFARIESTLSAMIARAESDRQRQREDIVYRRREFFRELLEGSRVVGAEEWAIETERLEAEQTSGFGGADAPGRDPSKMGDKDGTVRKETKLPAAESGRENGSPAFGSAVVGLLEIDRPEEFNRAYSERSRDLLRYALASAAGELAAARGARLWAEWLPGGRLGLLLRFAAGEEERPAPPEAAEALERQSVAAAARGPRTAAEESGGTSGSEAAAEASAEGAPEGPGMRPGQEAAPYPGGDAVSSAAAIAEELVAWVAAHLKCTVTVALGGELNSPEEISRGFREAGEAMGYKLSLGGARVIARRDLRRGGASELYGVLRTIRELALAYRLGEPEWKDRLDELLGELRAALLPKDDLSGLMNVLGYQLLREMMELPGEAKELWRSEAAPKLSAALESFDTLDELESAVRSLLEEYAVRLKLLRESRSSHVTLQEVRAYIDANFSDPNLSLSSIADRFGLSSSYLSRLFKDAFGENFVDYLAGVRVEAARKLLKETDEPIQGIAIRVGYANYMSFSRAFKKVASTTPGNYRSRSRTE
ncbi:AraC family transcriptional regulator [Saccharibacillus alkalitolerans]|uniref:Helix-turn-helix transcriptional regulator n=1 Tax=Saccharibacillus alkalitolerans TaxID=2705290 RepID=A0ABX0F8S8_9BACL|nr:AraC family transcriptional regulator [Saccharibacillus alkalitolerans]NGZ74412.1 helix-turn-helix transcriptional regulator [Saccharibacillus alkalitolerans]